MAAPLDILYPNGQVLAVIPLIDVDGDLVIWDGGVTSKFTTAIEFSGDNPIYIGIADPGSSKAAASWQIRKITFSGANPTDIQYANGSLAFDQIWNNRAALTYS